MRDHGTSAAVSMNRALRILLALAILLGGLAAAWMFQHPSPVADPPAQGAREGLVRREPVGQPAPAGPASSLPLVHLEAATPPERHVPLRNPLGVLAPMDPGEPPPPLVRSYPRDDLHVASHWGAALGLGRARPADGRGGPPAPAAQAVPPPVHKIVDGDTLRALAQRYLGSAERSLEIYEANRDVLPSPELLPIGVELRIPSRGSSAQPDPSTPQAEPGEN